jgi:AraC-like DNA-binding protein
VNYLSVQKETPLSLYWLQGENLKLPKSSSDISDYVPGYRLPTDGFRLMIKNGSGTSNLNWLISVKLNPQELKSVADSYKKMGYNISVLIEEHTLLETNPTMTKAYVHGKHRNLVSRTGDVSQLTYLVGTNTSWIKKNALTFIFVAIGIICVFGFLLFLIRMTAVAFANPIHKLEDYAKSRETQIQELLMSNLVEGTLNESKINESLKKLEIAVCPSFRMVGMICKSDADVPRETYERILAVMPEGMRQSTFIAPIFFGEMLLFIIGGEDEREVEDRTALQYKNIKDFIGREFQKAVACGISRPFYKLTFAEKAYNECRETAYDSFNWENMSSSTLVLFDDYSIRRQVNTVYDKVMAEELVQAVGDCREEESIRLLKELIRHMDAKKGIGIERNLYLARILTALLSIPSSHQIALTEIFDSDHYDILYRFQKIYDSKKLVRKIVEEIIHPVILKIQELEDKGNDSTIIRQIITLIKENKGNITLNECADQLSYHPNYLSRILKQTNGVTFTDMVNDEKIRQAKYMLTVTDFSIAEIAKKLRYNNAQNFIRFFKKHLGDTPAVFRKKHRIDEAAHKKTRTSDSGSAEKTAGAFQ